MFLTSLLLGDENETESADKIKLKERAGAKRGDPEQKIGNEEAGSAKKSPVHPSEQPLEQYF